MFEAHSQTNIEKDTTKACVLHEANKKCLKPIPKQTLKKDTNKACVLPFHLSGESHPK
jgi:hypothetical protein